MTTYCEKGIGAGKEEARDENKQNIFLSVFADIKKYEI